MANNSREKNFVKSTLILAFGTFLPKFASFITLPIYTGYLTKTEYGTYDLIQVLCTLLLPIATLQIQSAVFRFLLQIGENKRNDKAIVTILYCFMVPVSVVILAISFFVLNKMSIILRLLIITYYFFDILLLATKQVARGLKQNQKYSISSVINSFLNMGLVVVFLVYLRTGLNGLIFCLAVSALVSFVYLIFALRIWRLIDFSAVNKKLFVEMIQYSWPMVPNQLSLWVMRLSDRFLITVFLGAEANAVYAVANKIPTLLQLAQNTFSMAWAESASLTVDDTDADEYYSRMFKTIYRVLAGCAAGLMGTLPIMFALLIRGDYHEAYIHIPILIMGMFYSSIAVYMGGIYVANMKTKSIGVTTVIAASLNFLINLLFIHSIKIFAASFSTTISYLFLMVFRMVDVQKFQKISFDVPEIVITNVLLVLMGVLCNFKGMTFYAVNLVFTTTFAIVLNRQLVMSMLRSVLKKFR